MNGPAILDSSNQRAESALATIRRMNSDEVQTAIQWVAEEGWNPGINDAELFHRADPEGFFLATVEDKPVGCCSAVVYGGEFAFFGLFIVRPEFRGRGIGLQLTRAAMAHVGSCRCGLDGVVAMQAKYRDFGFAPGYRNIRQEGSFEGSMCPGVVSLNRVPFAEIDAFDRSHFGTSRSDFLRSWIMQPGAAALAYMSNGRLRGYGVIRPCRVGYKIGPLFAEDDRVADALFQSLCMSSHGSSVFLDTPEPNQAALALARRYGMRPCFETARMYANGSPDLPVKQIYGVTSFELG